MQYQSQVLFERGAAVLYDDGSMYVSGGNLAGAWLEKSDVARLVDFLVEQGLVPVLPIPVQMEDERIHTDDHPWCDDPSCACNGLVSEEEMPQTGQLPEDGTWYRVPVTLFQLDARLVQQALDLQYQPRVDVFRHDENLKSEGE
jgi:hypothetical protein